MANEYNDTDEFRGARFSGADFTGATFRGCDLRELQAADSCFVDVNVSGEVVSLVVNDVDVTAFVAAELDRRHPERVQFAEMVRCIVGSANTTATRCATSPCWRREAGR